MDLKEIKRRIDEGEFIYVPSEMAIGKAKKIVLEGPIHLKGCEYGYLYLEPGSGIKEHTHTTDVEKYELVNGTLSVKGEKMSTNICLLNESHNIDAVDELTIVKYTKVKCEDNSLVDDDFFDRVYQ